MSNSIVACFPIQPSVRMCVLFTEGTPEVEIKHFFRQKINDRNVDEISVLNTLYKTNKYLSCHCDQILVTFLKSISGNSQNFAIHHFIIRDSRPGSQFVFYYDFIKITATI